MDEFYLWRGQHVPQFGSWEYYNDLPFTQCFESAARKQQQQQQSSSSSTRLFHCSYNNSRGNIEDRDLYVAPGDLYGENHGDFVTTTPTVIVVPRRRVKKKSSSSTEKKYCQSKDVWVVCDQYYDESHEADEFKKIAAAAAQSPVGIKPKAVDEDLYKISPHLLRQVHSKKKKRSWCLFSSCLKPACS